MITKPLKRGPTPYYHQIAAILRGKMTGGELRVGDRLPSEGKLCSDFGVSRATVRQAIQSLVQENMLVREQGRGTFVSSVGGKVADLKMTCLLEDLIALGLPARSAISEVGIVSAGPAVAEALQATPGQPVFSFQRVLKVDKLAFSVKKFFLPEWMGERLTCDDLLQETLLERISVKCGIEVVEADQVIEAVLADAAQGELLDVTAGAPLLSVTRTSYTGAHVPVEHSLTLFRSDRTRFFISQRQPEKGSGDWVLAARGAGKVTGLNPSRRETRRQGGEST